MIAKVKVHSFKRFEDQHFDLSDHIVLAGPNNSGKTTLLQAISVWQLGLQKWTVERGAASTAKQRTGIPITRKDFTAVPLRDMKMLWTDASSSLKKGEAGKGKAGYPRVIDVTLEGKEGEHSWELTLEFRYQSAEQIYVKPSEKHIDTLPGTTHTFKAIHVPPFSGIGAEETRYDRPYQDLLVGQGKAGDILRNLLLEIYQLSDKKAWNELCGHIHAIFGYTLLPPSYEGRPFILCEYQHGMSHKPGSSFPRLDIASAGSGFHQVLLLLAFFYARPASVLLLDEPDAHLHVILQKQIYDLLRKVAADRSCQLIVATHSEVLIDGTSPERVISFYGQPHQLVADSERDKVREALKRLTAMDILSAEKSPGILYVEGETDFNLLRVWARVLNHPLYDWFSKKPFWHRNQGRHPREARGHFFALQAIKPEMHGFLLLDGDHRGLSEREVGAEGFVVERWTRYEAESYLIHPATLLRYIHPKSLPLFYTKAGEYLKEQMPPTVYKNPLHDHDYMASARVSKTLLPAFFRAADIPISKNEYYLIAEQMTPEEIADEVNKKLDAIQQAFRL